LARRKPKVEKGHVLFDVVYQDGARTSNRKVPATELGGLDGDDPARGYIEAEDRAIAEKSGRTRGPIKSIARTGKQKALTPGRK
jgi:hypothetical protein